MEPVDILIIKTVSGAFILSLAAYMRWHEKIEPGIMGALLLGAAAAVGFQLTG